MSTLSTATPQREGDITNQEELMQEAEQLSSDRATTRLNRRKLITNLSLAAGGAGMLGMAGCSNVGPAPIAVPAGSSTPTALEVLNFALNLEYFEASFYSYAVTGSGLSTADMGTGAGTVTGGAKITFQYTSIQNIAQNLMTEEIQHVEFLRATILAAGGTPVPMPNLNLTPKNITPATNDATFVALARTLEGVGVSAYAGGSQYLTGNVAALQYAASILDVEAQHEGALRQACIYFPGGTAVVSPAADAYDLPPTATQIFNTNPQTGLNTVRTISQVLGIVYGASAAATTTPAAGTVKGGFFPNGFNGNIFTT